MDPVIDLNAELAKCKTIEDLTGSNGLIKRLLGCMIEKMLDAEMDINQIKVFRCSKVERLRKIRPEKSN